MAGRYSETLTDAVRRVAVLFLAATCLAGCGVDQSAPAPGVRIDSLAAASRPIPTASRRTMSDSLSSLHDVVASGMLVGQRVRVVGRCITPPRVPALGLPRPVLVVWQLEADGVTVLVSGAPPAGCTSADGSNTVAITALVAEDTLPAIGDLPASLRRYLVRIESTGADSAR